MACLKDFKKVVELNLFCNYSILLLSHFQNRHEIPAYFMLGRVEIHPIIFSLQKIYSQVQQTQSKHRYA